ncbi:hypothetical protein [Synechococcus sp. PCC 7336]|uniref:hypothetical protein n=1 Tax=Synechococcus sp. PCC 7336 TaxID=195250 RepID=UPI00034B4AA2|nr:hypothetical protein [Synechococcus sp. PCC 7336]
MSFDPTPKQVRVMWNLLFTGEEPAISKIKPQFSPAERKPLIEAGLVDLEKRGRSNHMVLTDKAWEWAIDHLNAEVPKSRAAAPILQAALTKLQAYLRSQGIPLAEFLAPQNASSDHRIAAPIATTSLEERIRTAYAKLADGRSNVRVRLAQLRQHLEDLSRDEIDSTLRSMQLDGQLVLIHMDNPQEMQPEDELAAIAVGAGKRHIIYMQG